MGPCPHYDCTNRNSFGYCDSTACINPNYNFRSLTTMQTVDLVEVVRCKDCKHRDPEDHKCDSGALERAGCVFPVADDYFCSWGERREDETD